MLGLAGCGGAVFYGLRCVQCVASHCDRLFATHTDHVKRSNDTTALSPSRSPPAYQRPKLHTELRLAEATWGKCSTARKCRHSAISVPPRTDRAPKQIRPSHSSYYRPVLYYTYLSPGRFPLLIACPLDLCSSLYKTSTRFMAVLS